MAYGESAVRTIASMSRSLMAGASHLDESCWGLSDVYSCSISVVTGIAGLASLISLSRYVMCDFMVSASPSQSTS
jgi:hypothetical protein